MSIFLRWCCLVGLTALASNTAYAQSPAAVPPDVVETQDGGFVRGTIVERKPGEYVVVQLVTGEVRTIEMNDVAYAGPEAKWHAADSADEAGGAPPRTNAAAEVAAQPDDGKVAIAVEASDEGARLALHALSASVSLVGGSAQGGFAAEAEGFAPLCPAPCSLRLELGHHYFGVSFKDRGPVRVKTPVRIDAPSTLHLDYKNRQGLRVAGWVVFATTYSLAAVLGGLAAAGGAQIGVTLGVTLVPMAIGALISVPLIAARDRADVRVELAPAPQ